MQSLIAIHFPFFKKYIGIIAHSPFGFKLPQGRAIGFQSRMKRLFRVLKIPFAVTGEGDTACQKRLFDKLVDGGASSPATTTPTTICLNCSAIPVTNCAGKRFFFQQSLAINRSRPAAGKFSISSGALPDLLLCKSLRCVIRKISSRGRRSRRRPRFSVRFRLLTACPFAGYGEGVTKTNPVIQPRPFRRTGSCRPQRYNGRPAAG